MFRIILLFFLAAAAFHVLARTRMFGARVMRDSRAVLEGARPSPGAAWASGTPEGLPACVRGYFAKVLPGDAGGIRGCLLTQEGQFLMRPEAGAWAPFQARQVISCHPPGFVWDARMPLAPGIRVRAADAYAGGLGSLEVRVAGAFPVVQQAGGDEMSRGQLMRWLAEGAWCPPALLPRPGLTWEEVGEDSARAVLEQDGYRVDLMFHFDGDGLIRKVVGVRARMAPDGTSENRPWSGRFFDYQDYGGLLLPKTARVSWHLPGGEQEYFRGMLTSVEILR